MNKLLKVILIILCVAAVVHLVFLFNTNGSFWVGFWQNFYSDLLVGIAITYLVTWYISRSQKLDLELKVFVEGTKPDKRVLNFVLLNKGNVGFDAQQVYYHIYLIKEFEKFISESEGIRPVITVGGVKALKIEGLIGGPVYPQRPTEIRRMQLNGIKGVDLFAEGWDIAYLFSTPKGVIPNGAVLESALGIRWGNLGKTRLSKITENHEQVIWR